MLVIISAGKSTSAWRTENDTECFITEESVIISFTTNYCPKNQILISRYTLAVSLFTVGGQFKFWAFGFYCLSFPARNENIKNTNADIL